MAGPYKILVRYAVGPLQLGTQFVTDESDAETMNLIHALLGKKFKSNRGVKVGSTIWQMVDVCAGALTKEWGAGELTSEGIR